MIPDDKLAMTDERLAEIQLRREYKNWVAMKQRCHNTKNKSFKNYGDRGIFVCDEWRKSFQTYYNDMKCPRPVRAFLDRVDNDGPYSKENCRWVTPEESNQKNRRIILTPKDVLEIKLSKERHADIGKKYGVSRKTIDAIIGGRSWKNILASLQPTTGEG